MLSQSGHFGRALSRTGASSLSLLHFSGHTVVRIRAIARTWITVMIVAFFFQAFRDGIPQSPDRDDWERYAQLGLLAAICLGTLLTIRWEGFGAMIITLGAVGLGSLAALEFQPWQAFLVALAFYIPGLLFWLAWLQRKGPLAIGVLAITLVVLLITGGISANRIYATYFGPVQPESALAAQPVDAVEWIWAGATTEHGFTVKAAMADGRTATRIAIARDSSLSTMRYVALSQVGSIVAATASDLEEDTDYWFAIEVNGVLDRSRTGHVRTFPARPASFTFAFGACAQTGSSGVVFDTIRGHNPLFYMVTGDFYYENIAVNDEALFQQAYATVLTSPAQSALFQSTSAVYMWDDHDYGPNDSDSTSPSREAARAVYRQLVPHYPLMAGEGDQAIYQAFSVGRVRFIVTDTRSERSPESDPDGPTKTMLGSRQKAWFKQELLSAKQNYPVIVWVNSVPWIADTGGDGWGAYASEREELSTFITDNRIQGVVMLSGDAHMLAIDDGSNSNYASSGETGFPVFHAAALDRHGSRKGGPYSEGGYPGGGQFGLMTVLDNGGDDIEIILSGRNYKDEEIVAYQFSVAAPPFSEAALKDPGAGLLMACAFISLFPANHKRRPRS